MKFDLYGSLSPQPEPKIPTMNTMDALQAATWTPAGELRWQLVWEDHTEYADADIGGEGGTWTCDLYVDGETYVYDFEHDSRGGPQHGNGTDIDIDEPVERAMEMARKHIGYFIERWTEANVDKMDDRDEDY